MGSIKDKAKELAKKPRGGTKTQKAKRAKALRDSLQGLTQEEIRKKVQQLNEEEVKELSELIIANLFVYKKWNPQSGTQEMAYFSDATIVGFGGSLGGGKSDLMIALAILHHEKSIIFRKSYSELTGIINRIEEILGTSEGLNKSDKIWKFGEGRYTEFGAVDHEDSLQKFQGRAHDFIGIDEADHFEYQHFKYLTTWLRTTNPKLRPRVLLTFNPPKRNKGFWLINMFKPWILPYHPDTNPIGMYHPIHNPDGVKSGDILHYITVDGVEKYYRHPVKAKDSTGRTIYSVSRTFIKSTLDDNEFLDQDGQYSANVMSGKDSDYAKRMLDGDFTTTIEDSYDQIIPTSWIESAFNRYDMYHAKLKSGEIKKDTTVLSMGIDVGHRSDNSVIYTVDTDNCVECVLSLPAKDIRGNQHTKNKYGDEQSDGAKLGSLIMSLANSYKYTPKIILDVNGIGDGAYTYLRDKMPNANRIVKQSFGQAENKTFRSGGLPQFANRRVELFMKLVDELDPSRKGGATIKIPRNQDLLEELIRFTSDYKTGKMQITSTEDLRKELDRSPDYTSALCMAMDRPKNITELKSITGIGRSGKKKRSVRCL